MEFYGRDCSHALALSLKKNGKLLVKNLIGETPFILRVLWDSKNIDKYKFGYFVGKLNNWFCCTMDSKKGFNLKLLASNCGDCHTLTLSMHLKFLGNQLYFCPE